MLNAAGLVVGGQSVMIAPGAAIVAILTAIILARGGNLSSLWNLGKLILSDSQVGGANITDALAFSLDTGDNAIGSAILEES
jgi:hypothetical protein